MNTQEKLAALAKRMKDVSEALAETGSMSCDWASDWADELTTLLSEHGGGGEAEPVAFVQRGTRRAHVVWIGEAEASIADGAKLYAGPGPHSPAEREAVELTRCCGREECGGECGNPWRGMEWVAIRKATTPPTPPTQSAPDVAMEAWRSAVDDAGELRANAPDDRYASRAARVESWIMANRPAPPSAPVVDDAMVDRALAAYWGVFEKHGAGTGADGHAMRAALERALTPAATPSGEDQP